MSEPSELLPTTSPPPERRPLPFEFRGTASEYFGIWIVNLLLSIVTLGIYSAWAKVRRLRYFYGNTYLDGHNFDYHARPVQILIGRIIVVGALLVINVLTQINPLFVFMFLPYFVAFPWIINVSMRFNAHMTSYRNVRFSFHGSYFPALGVFVLMPMVAALSAGLLAPVASRMASNYIGSRLRFGTAKFTTDAPLGQLYANFGATIVVVIAGIVLSFLVSLAVDVFPGSMSIAAHGTDEATARMIMRIFVGIIVFYAVVFLTALFYGAGVRNIAFNATSLEGGYYLSSFLSRVRYVWILVSNVVLTIITLGLMRPWAAIRTWRYFAASTALVATGTLDSFVDEVAPQGNAAAAEYLDVGGIDFGL